ncbi:DUF4344 domain-containing metallopeptidase [Pseudooceanicola sp. HF7]|uniref:DUF4344 domain-containing metallopeptidase n=1 Tax=Pseudooceanicola sp. HF7 TaxID=2721560 RepID=UPI00142FD074|nr:DUF4344 domain-containing metallopeptidase [Pseudooceanicola sp. HF7]NIZ09497.1 hypothetical protein [Pseudooceanicola sp. HF7]
MFRTVILAAAMASAPPLIAQDKQVLSQATTDALVHVVAHEIGHAFLREFDLPMIGPEEAIVDDFATVYVHLMFPERVEQIVAARADQNLADGEEAGRFSEYLDDDQRAGRSVCLLYGLEPERYESLVERYDMNDDDVAACRDFGPEVGRAWRRLLDAHRMPDRARVTEVRLIADQFPLSQMIVDSELSAMAYDLLSEIDWHSLITLSLERCEGETGWSRNQRKITICDSYVERFEEQLSGH